MKAGSGIHHQLQPLKVASEHLFDSVDSKSPESQRLSPWLRGPAGWSHAQFELLPTARSGDPEVDMFLEPGPQAINKIRIVTRRTVRDKRFYASSCAGVGGRGASFR